MLTGPGGGGPGVPRGTRTVLSRHNLPRTYHNALAKLADPGRPAATDRPARPADPPRRPRRRPQRVDQLAAAGRRPIRPATVAAARVIDEPMGHEATGRSGQHRDSAMGAHYRHTTPRWPPRSSTPSSND
jgi:hypothetical protein